MCTQTHTENKRYSHTYSVSKKLLKSSTSRIRQSKTIALRTESDRCENFEKQHLDIGSKMKKMKKMKEWIEFIFFLAVLYFSCVCGEEVKNVDVLVLGAGLSGVGKLTSYLSHGHLEIFIFVFNFFFFFPKNL